MVQPKRLQPAWNGQCQRTEPVTNAEHASGQYAGLDWSETPVKDAARHVQALPARVQFLLFQHSPPLCPLRNDNGGKRALHFLLEQARANHLRFWRNILTTLKTVTESASEFGKEAKESVEELSRTAGRRLDAVRSETGAALHTAASSVRSTGRQGSEAIDNLAAGAADRLDATASLVEDHDLRDVLIGLRRFGRRHLAGSLIAAAVIGFFAGSALRRRTHTSGRPSEDTQE